MAHGTNTCRWRKKDGSPCEVEIGKARKCGEHMGRKCAVCGSPAGRDCEHPDCEVVLCRSVVCRKKHLASAHAPEKTEPELRVADKADPCPACQDIELPRVFVFERPKNNSGAIQVQCSGCGITGPRCKSASLATTGWNRMPRGRPAVYESIRLRGLRLIDNALAGYEQASNNRPLTDMECRAVAAMLEAATMTVDTWEL